VSLFLSSLVASSLFLVSSFLPFYSFFLTTFNVSFLVLLFIPYSLLFLPLFTDVSFLLSFFHPLPLSFKMSDIAYFSTQTKCNTHTQHSTAQHSTAQHSTAHCCSTLHSKLIQATFIQRNLGSRGVEYEMT